MRGRISRAERAQIGWREWIGLPELGVKRIKVKVDTGARSSALHASDVEYFSRRGRPMVRFKVHPIQRDTRRTVLAEAALVERRPVRNSGGRSELRPVIRTTVRFLDEDWTIDLTLTGRDVMGFRMLLGREAVRGRFVVDPGRSFVGGRPKKKKKKKRGTKRQPSNSMRQKKRSNA